MTKYSNLKEIKVLYIEDEEYVKEEIVDMLSLKVGKLFEASDGQEGFESYEKNDPDIIITDINMPKLNGMELIERIRQNNKEIPIIVTSALNECNLLTKAIDLHVDKYIIKPIDINELFSSLDKTTKILSQKTELRKKDFLLNNEERINAIEELLENIAHHWRQPLSVITTSISGMRVDKEMNNLSDENFFENCDIIDTNAQTLSKMIDNFRNHFCSNQKDEIVDLKILINDYLDLIKIPFNDQNIMITTKLDNIEAKVVKNDIFHILLILFNNAKDVLLRSNKKEKIIQIELKNDQNNIVLKVIDNGGGIKEDHMKKVFEPYFTTKHSYSGTGMGLFIVHELVKNSLKGSIDIKNSTFFYNDTQYKGAEFKIQF